MDKVHAALWGGLPAVMLLTASVMGPGEESRGGIWPTYRGNPQRTGESPFKGPARMRVKWEADLKHEIAASPAVGPDGTIYVVANPILCAVSPDGKVLWSYNFVEGGYAQDHSSGGFTTPTPTLAPDGTLYQAVGQHEQRGHILAIDTRPAAAKRVKWAHETRSKMRASPLLLDGICHLGLPGGMLALNGAGEPKWRQSGPYYVTSSPALSPDAATLYRGGSDGSLHALDVATGEEKWKAGRGEDAAFRLPEEDARGNVTRYFTTSGNVSEAPAVGPDGTIYFGSWDGYLRAAAPDGQIRWAIDLKDRLTSAPAIASDGRILVCTFEGALYAVRAAGGRPVVDWSAPANARYSSPLVAADGKVYVGTLDGRLLAFALANGEKVGELAFPREDPEVLPGWITASPVPGGDGVLYIGGQDGVLRAIE